MASARGHSGFLPAVLVVYGCMFLFTFHEADEDVWGRMAVGRLVLGSETFPYQDVFAYVPTKPLVVDHEWLAGVVFYEVHRFLGGAGLVWLRAVLGLAAVGLAFAVGRLRGGAPAAVAALSLAAAALVVQGFNSVVRAQVFSFALFASSWWLLEGGGRRAWLLVPGSALWASLHGGVVTGGVLIGAYAAGAPGRRRSLALVGVLAGAATLANPYGVHYWRYLAAAITMPRPEIVEWRSVSLVPVLDDLHLKLAAIAVVVLVLLARRHVSTPSLIVLLGTLVASWMHVRFAPFLGFAMVASLPRALEAVFERGAAAFPVRWAPSVAPLVVTVSLLALVATGVVVASSHGSLVPRMRVPEDRYPVAAVQELESSGAAGRLAVYFNWGEYALYHLYPRIRVSIDGRYETVYPDAVVRANWDFTRGAPGGERLVEAYPADFALYPPDSGPARWLEPSSDWKRIYSSDASVLYTNLETDTGRSLGGR